MTLPASLEYGHVVGRIILAVADGADGDRMPDSAPATGTVTFTPKNPQIRVGGAAPVLVVKQPITCTLDGAGNVIDPEGATGAWLVTGVYSVKYSLGPQVPTVTHDIEVLASHTDTDPLDLTTALPPGGPVLTASEYAELSSRIDSLEIGAVSWDTIADKPATFPPTGHAGSHASDGSDPITPASIGAEPTIPDTGWRRLFSWTGGVQDASGQFGTINTTNYTLIGNGFIDMRRRGDWVFLRTSNAVADTFATTGSSVALDFAPSIPVGFRIQDGGMGRVTPLNHDGLESIEIRRNGGGGLGFPTREGPVTLLRPSGSWWTFETFPSQPYPGTPA